MSTPAASRRGRRGLGLIALALLIVPILEIAVIIAVGRVIGGWPTLALLLVESALGAWIVRREGGRAWQALSVALRTGAMPSRELSDAALILIGGTLLLAPGFVTDIVGFFIILPLTRPITRRLLEGIIARRLLGAVRIVPGGGAGPSIFGQPGPPRDAGDYRRTRRGGGDVVEGEIVDD